MAEVTSRGGKKASKTPPTEAEIQIRVLTELCREGKLFAVQEWIAAGKPVNPPPATRKGIQPQTPLEIAFERGFHSLVEVLLKGGADIQADKWNGPMDRVLKLRRLDLVQLLVAHGYDPKAIRMRDVFETWDPEIMEFFIDRGADVKTDYPVAEALKNRIRTVLRILKRYGEQFPHLQKQANIALRHHCREGDSKWVSLLLWAGADPYDESSDWPDDGEEHDEGTAALVYAALHRHFQIFNLRGILLQPDHPVLQQVLKWSASCEEGLPLVSKLLKIGVSPNDQENGGCSAIQSYLQYLSWGTTFNIDGEYQRQNRDIDDDRARQHMKGIFLLAKAGARWQPVDSGQITEARRSLVKMIPDYTLEFIWIMGKFQTCSKEDILNLLRTSRMKLHLNKHQPRLRELLEKWNENPQQGKRQREHNRSGPNSRSLTKSQRSPSSR
ncbi:ankyrin repeat domain-containing protein [Planctomicrobium sp. SH527]|uniref:ankyrin repeat domain-containing protein n=1 Tax=Planctomicrobium sp. SH527 TaxID=3448123 RepID=UPI003F5B4F62